jgi:hypothetical protein
MIGHQAVGMKTEWAILLSKAQQAQEAVSVGVVMEDGKAADAAVGDVIDQAWDIDAGRAGHISLRCKTRQNIHPVPEYALAFPIGPGPSRLNGRMAHDRGGPCIVRPITVPGGPNENTWLASSVIRIDVVWSATGSC